MALQHDLGIQVGDTPHCIVEVVDLEPQQDAVAVGFVVRITDRVVVMPDVELVQLKNQDTARDQPLVSLPPCALWQPRRRWYQRLLASTSVTAMRG